MPKHSEREREGIVAGLPADDRKVYDYLTRSPSWLGEAQIAQGLKAAPQQVAPILGRLLSKGLLQKSDPTPNRPFAALYRPAPCRVITVGDWLKGGEHDRGYADLDAIRRDYPSVKTLADPADGAEAERDKAEREAALAAEKKRQEEELRAQQEEEEAARKARQAEKAEALAAQEKGGGE